MSKNCAFLSVYKYSFIITCIKNVSFLALCLLSTPCFILSSPSWKEPSISFSVPLTLFSSSALYSWLRSRPCHRNGYILSKLLHCPPLSCFSRTWCSWPCSLEHCLFLGCVFSCWCVPRTWACFFFSFLPFIDNLQGLVLDVLSFCILWCSQSPELLHMKLWISQALHASTKVPISPLCSVPGLLPSLSQAYILLSLGPLCLSTSVVPHPESQPIADQKQFEKIK